VIFLNAIIIHGAYGNPNENWFPWLKKELEKTGCTVSVPKFPTPENQTLESWLNVFNDYEDKIEGSILIAHSLGVPFILNILEKTNKKVKACFFVSGFAGKLGNSKFDEINKSFLKDFDWEKIKQNCEVFYVFHSDNDPYVALKKAEELTSDLGVPMILVEGAGHFNSAAGYDKFEILLKNIKIEL